MSENHTPILFHTIAIEPARWTPRRVARPLVGLLPHIADAGFKHLEIFEPHLLQTQDLDMIREMMAALEMTPVMLSSYINLNPAQTPDVQVPGEIEKVTRLIKFFDFKKMRVFAGPGMDPADAAAVAVFIKRINKLAAALPHIEILLETHDGSIADNPAVLVDMMQKITAPNIGLLFQPTFFDAEKAIAQIQLEAPLIRHIHLQNRNLEKGFKPLADGLFSWPALLAELPSPVPMTLEFTPIGICSTENFDLAATLAEAKSEIAYIESILK